MINENLSLAFEKHLGKSKANCILKAIKQKGWEKFKTLPMPKSNEEKWRFSNLTKFSFKNFKLPIAPNTSLKKEIINRSNIITTYIGRNIFLNDLHIQHDSIDNNLKKKGIIWDSLKKAFINHPELIKKYFFKLSTKLGLKKFQSLHKAYFNNGSFLFIPSNIYLEEPLVNYYWIAGNQTAIFPHTLVVAEKNSHANIIDCYFSNSTEESALSVSIAHVYAESESYISRKTIQCFNKKTFVFQIENNNAKRNSNIENTAINLGSMQTRLDNEMHIQGEGGNITAKSLTIANYKQEFDQRTLQVHDASNTFSNVLYKNVLLDCAKTIFSGLIQVEEKSQKTDAYQTNHNLLLSKMAKAISLPGLEIKTKNRRLVLDRAICQLFFCIFSHGKFFW